MTLHKLSTINFVITVYLLKDKLHGLVSYRCAVTFSARTYRSKSVLRITVSFRLLDGDEKVNSAPNLPHDTRDGKNSPVLE